MITKLLIKTGVLGVFVLMCSNVKAQVVPTDSALTKLFETNTLLPLLIDSAIKNSPEVRRSNSSMDLWEENTKINKKNFLNGISFVSSYNYGTTGDLTIGKEGVVGGQFSNFSSSKSDRYNVGVNVQIPITSITSRKSLVRTTEIQGKMAEAEKDISINYVKQQVIRLYQDLKLSQRLLIISSKGKQVAYVNYNLSEKDFLQGDGNVDQLSRLHDIYTKASIEYDSYVNRFQTNYLQLEVFTGTRLSNLIEALK